MKWLRFTALAASATAVAMVVAFAPTLVESQNSGTEFTAELSGFQEVPAISTAGRGEFRATIVNESQIQFQLQYSDLEGGAISAAHIHFGQRSVNGGVSAFLCGGAKPPRPPSGTITGTVTALDVMGPAEQGIGAQQFSELVRAMRAGVTYANVHTGLYPNGEIRGQLEGIGVGGGDRFEERRGGDDNGGDRGRGRGRGRERD